ELGRRGWAGGKRDGDGEERQRQEQANRAKHGGGPPATEGAIVAGGVRNSKAHIVIAPEAACHYLRAPLFGGLLALGFGRLVIRLERDEIERVQLLGDVVDAPLVGRRKAPLNFVLGADQVRLAASLRLD